MEQERIARENEEKERAEKMKKIKDQFSDPNSQWEKDKTDIQNEALKEKAREKEKEELENSARAEDVKADTTDKKDTPVKEIAGDANADSKPETKAESKAEGKAETKEAQDKVQ